MQSDGFWADAFMSIQVIGASSKDAGKKLCAINKVDSVQMIHPVIDRLLLLPDKQI